MPQVRVAFLSKIDDADGYRDFAQRATAMVREEDPGPLSTTGSCRRTGPPPSTRTCTTPPSPSSPTSAT